MTTAADITAALAANPRDTALWLIAGDAHEEYGTKRQCTKCGGQGRIIESGSYGYDTTRRKCRLCSGTGEFSEATYCRAMSRVLWWEPGNEAWHGEEQYLCSGTKATYAARHTFALLYDHPGKKQCSQHKGQWLGWPLGTNWTCPECLNTGKAIIPGHHRELVADLRGLGLEEMAGRVEEQVVVHVSEDPPAWIIGKYIPGVYYSYPDACREACARIWQAMTEPCECVKGVTIPGLKLMPMKDCPDCLGLGWRLRLQ